MYWPTALCFSTFPRSKPGTPKKKRKIPQCIILYCGSNRRLSLFFVCLFFFLFRWYDGAPSQSIEYWLVCTIRIIFFLRSLRFHRRRRVRVRVNNTNTVNKTFPSHRDVIHQTMMKVSGIGVFFELDWVSSQFSVDHSLQSQILLRLAVSFAGSEIQFIHSRFRRQTRSKNNKTFTNSMYGLQE